MLSDPDTNLAFPFPEQQLSPLPAAPRSVARLGSQVSCLLAMPLTFPGPQCYFFKVGR